VPDVNPATRYLPSPPWVVVNATALYVEDWKLPSPFAVVPFGRIATLGVASAI
jgi:hypothetical protein